MSLLFWYLNFVVILCRTIDHGGIWTHISCNKIKCLAYLDHKIIYLSFETIFLLIQTWNLHFFVRFKNHDLIGAIHGSIQFPILNRTFSNINLIHDLTTILLVKKNEKQLCFWYSIKGGKKWMKNSYQLSSCHTAEYETRRNVKCVWTWEYKHLHAAITRQK